MITKIISGGQTSADQADRLFSTRVRPRSSATVLVIKKTMKKLFAILIIIIIFQSTLVYAQKDPRRDCPCRIFEDTKNRQIKLLDRNGLILKIYPNTYTKRNIKLYYNDNVFYVMRKNSGIYQVTVYDIVTGRSVRTYSVRSTDLDNWIK